MAINPLPKTLDVRLAELSRRVYRLNVLRGLSRLLLLLLAFALVAISLDALIRLSITARAILLAGWLGLALFEIRRFIFGPFTRLQDTEGLAAAIEKEYPRLGERLTTAVELAGRDDLANGSPHLVEMLVYDVETRTQKLDLNRAAPLTATFVLAGLSLVLLAAVVTPLVTVPKAAEQAQRFFVPWHTPIVEVGYRVIVTSGDPAVKRGEQTTLSAIIEATKPDIAFPDSATALLRTDRGTERVPMIFDETKREAYLKRGPLDRDFEYQIQSGSAESDWHRVSVIDPVRIESARITIAPPKYAQKADERPLQLEGLSDLRALQYGSIAFELQFNRLPSAAWLEWKPQTTRLEGVSAPTV